MPDAPPDDPLEEAACGDLLGVSRETLARLAAYLDLLRRWQERINLVGPATLADPWRRHVLDCGQLRPLLPGDPGPVLDLGSGAGLPGLVLAIMGVPGVHLVESDRRKSAFLREAARVTGAAVTVHPERAERLPPVAASAVTARALAPLPRLLGLAAPFLQQRTVCLFLKGRGASAELTEARRSWTMNAETRRSLADAAGTILILREIRPLR